MLFMGIDIGTQGVRAVVADSRGQVCAGASEGFRKLNCAAEEGYYEQEADSWWEAVRAVLGKCMEQLKLHGRSGEEISAVSIDGTSGTVLPLDSQYRPLSPALMYNDMRSKEQAYKTHRVGIALEEKMGLRFNASFALPKFLWIKENMPEVYEKTEIFVHQSDYITGKLTGEYRITDYSNALKSGYDLVEDCWPDFIQNVLGIEINRLPKVIAPGYKIAEVLPDIAKEFGFSKKTAVVAGATDGYASALAAGAVKAGDWASIIGTTLVLKGVTEKLMIDPAGSSYSHKLPSGCWMLGGAANIGGRCLNDYFPGESFETMNRTVMHHVPTGVISYPLHGRGERFPFLDPDATALFLGDISDREVHYTAIMEGVAYAERLAFERMISCGAPVGEVIYTTGGACKSKEWLKIRASVLNHRLVVPREVDAAMGCAILAASTSCYHSLEEASAEMINFAEVIDPDEKLTGRYEELYQRAYEVYSRLFRLGDGGKHEHI